MNRNHSQRRKVCILLAAMFASVGHSTAGDLNVPGDYPTIQQAIDVASGGDNVWVGPGTYFEHLDFLGKAIRVESTDGPALTIVDGSDLDTVVRFVNGESAAAILRGFTITHGCPASGSSDGGGILCVGSSPTIAANVITANEASAGGGIACFQSAATIVDNEISDNDVDYGGVGAGMYLEDSPATVSGNLITGNGGSNVRGSGMACFSSPATIERNEIVDNFAFDGEGAGIYLASDSDALVRHNSIRGNRIAEVPVGRGYGGGVSCFRSNPVIAFNRIQDNWASADLGDATGGGVHLRDSMASVYGNLLTGNRATSSFYALTAGGGISIRGASQPSLRGNTLVDNYGDVGGAIWNGSTQAVLTSHCILWENQGLFGPDEIVDINGTLVVEYSNVDGGWPGLNNLDADPLFAADYSIPPSSPCADAGDPSFYSAAPDLLGVPRVLDADLDRQDVVDLGAFEATHVRAAVSGNLTPGGSMRIQLVGTPGLPALLIAGLDAGEFPLRPFGALYVDLSNPFLILALGTLDVDWTVGIPASIPAGTQLELQGLAVHASSGNLSNRVSALIE